MAKEDYNYIPEGLVDSFNPPPQPIPSGFADEVYADVMREERVANILSQLNPDNLLDEIEHRLKGMKKNMQTGQWEYISSEVKKLHPMLISNFLSFLSWVLSQETSMSNFSGNDINRIMKIIIEWVADDLDSHSHIYGIYDDYTERTRVGMIVVGSCYSVFKQAQDGAKARRIFGALRVTENLNSQGMPHKKGVLDYFKFWG